MKDRPSNLIIKKHFDDLKSALENSGRRAYILIIDYLINFLGCLVLSALIKKHKGSEISRDRNISNLTAGEWVDNIEKWISKYFLEGNLEGISAIRTEFIQKGDHLKLYDYIREWIKLRNIISHERILIDDETLNDLLGRKLFQPMVNVDLFIKSLLKIIEENKNILDENFFIFQDGVLFIYFGIDTESNIKNKHYNLDPIIIRKKDFPLPYREVFLSLSPTPPNILAGKDVIEAEMKTLRSFGYQNDFELWINRKLVTRKSYQNYFDGDTIILQTNSLQLKGIPRVHVFSILHSCQDARKGADQNWTGSSSCRNL